MYKFKVLFVMTILALLPNAYATMLPVSQSDLMSNCYPSSPMLMSDVCFGQVYSGSGLSGLEYRSQQGDPFSDIYMLMNSLRGNMNSMDTSLNYSLSNPMLWQNTMGIPEYTTSVLSPYRMAK
ncbi:MAG: hypothetical protein JNL11_05410 [Bdellovibrionaceae bacterium]|nr:hypothetical protein [Pseudobdellovibrionaceae bacterium]